MKLFVHTFGCQMNEADSQEMTAHLRSYGIISVSNQDDADIVLLNTCTVRQHAEDKALSFIGRIKAWKKKKPGGIFIVAGCAAERLKDSLKKRFPQIDLVVGAKSMGEIGETLDAYFKTKFSASRQRQNFDWFNESETSFGNGNLRVSGKPLLLGQEGETAFVTIMRGCNYSCSYCIVPSVRGREFYRPPDEILQEIEWKASHGAKKVMMLGQTVNSYWHKQTRSNGASGKILDFADLIRVVDDIDAIEEIRFMSPHPHYMNDKLIAALGDSRKVSPEIHLPVQSGSNKILNAMKRNYTREEYLETASKMRRAVPGLKLSTDFIVGFPGETEADFEETLSLAETVRFSMAFCFKYSARKGTISALMTDDVPRSVKEKRLARLLEKVDTRAVA